MKKLLIVLMILALTVPAALAESVTVDGTVVSTETMPVISSVNGVLAKVLLREGDHVEAGQEVAELYAGSVYADQSGTVRVMGSVGDSLEALVSRYGAVVYIEPDCQYTISASTRYAYDVEENSIIHPGEAVYLRCASDGAHTGEGRVTAVSGSNFTVEVTDGSFESGENVYVCRESDYAAKSRIGRGEAVHAAPVAYAGEGVGTVYGLYVGDGEAVETGELLFKTVETAYARNMAVDVAGTVAAMRVAAGDAVTSGMVVADIYPDEAMRIEIRMSENDLRDVHVGTRVSIEFTGGEAAEGEIDRISSVALVGEDAEDDTVYFAAYVRFEAQAAVRYGMTAKVTTLEDDARE